MSIELMNHVWKLELPTNEKIVLLAYADHARPDGTCIFPSVGLLARKTSYSEREVQRITRKLHQYLIPDGTGPRGTRRWRLEIPDELEGRAEAMVTSPAPLEPQPEAARRAAEPLPPSGAEGVTSVRSALHEMSPLTTAGATSEAAGGDRRTDEPVTSVPPESSLTIIEPPTRSGLSSSDIEKANAKVNAMIALSAHATYLNRDKIPEPYLAYADTYNVMTGQVPTQRVLADWLSTFGVWKSEGVQAAHIRQAIESSRGRFTVVRPGSLTDTAAALRAKATVSKARGETRGWTEASIAEFQFKLDRSRRVQAEWYMSRGMRCEDPETMRPRIADIPRLLSTEPEEPFSKQATGDVRAKIGELVKSLGSPDG
jgi:hypothetical protein